VISAVEAQQTVLVHVAAHHQRGRRAAEQAGEPAASGRRPEPVGRCGRQLRSGRGYGLMSDKRNRLAAAIPAGLFVKPRPLRVLGRQARTDKLRVDRQENPAASRYRPVVGADDVEPPLLPAGVDGDARGGARPRVVADVMVAGNRMPRHRQPVKLGAAMTQVRSVACPVQAEITKVDHQVRGAGSDVAEHSVPVGLRLRRGRRQVSVRHQDHARLGHSGHGVYLHLSAAGPA